MVTYIMDHPVGTGVTDDIQVQMYNYIIEHRKGMLTRWVFDI